VKEADASHFFHLLDLDGKALAPPPPERTRQEKLAFLAANIKGAEMTLPTVKDYLHARSERLSKVRKSAELLGCIR